MIFLELTDSCDTKVLINPSSIAYIEDHGKNACIVLNSGRQINMKSDYETIKAVLKQALRRK